MLYVVVMLLGVFGGGVSVYLALAVRRITLDKQEQLQQTQSREIREKLTSIAKKEKDLAAGTTNLGTERQEFDSRFIAHKDLQDENFILKHDLQNIDVNLRKLQLDRDRQQETQEAIDKRSQELGIRYLNENVKWIGSDLNPNNFTKCKDRLQKVIGRCRDIGIEVSSDKEKLLLAVLREDFEKAVRSAFEREEQARIKAQIREEQRLEKEIDREIRESEREQTAIEAVLKKALSEATDKHSDEVERLKAKLAEAQEKLKRAKSRAQMTRSGYVYVISNIGSFGEDVFKIGMTRRLDPMDRVRELSVASVPFRFDVHMMISSDDAPALENSLHRMLQKLRLNKVNHRKEFFRTNIETIREMVESQHGEVEYVADAEALEYRQSLDMSDEDLVYLESVYDKLDDDGSAFETEA